ncbi:hypothetical protein ACVIWU_006670 [Bradyrhizobium sp. USDA 4509]
MASASFDGDKSWPTVAISRALPPSTVYSWYG